MKRLLRARSEVSSQGRSQSRQGETGLATVNGLEGRPRGKGKIAVKSSFFVRLSLVSVVCALTAACGESESGVRGSAASGGAASANGSGGSSGSGGAGATADDA